MPTLCGLDFLVQRVRSLCIRWHYGAPVRAGRTSPAHGQSPHRQSGRVNQAATGAEALSLVGAAATGFCGARFAGAFLATASFAAVFLTAAFFADADFVTALTFFAATVFPVTFFVAAFFAVAFPSETTFEPEAPSAAATIRNFERSLA